MLSKKSRGREPDPSISVPPNFELLCDATAPIIPITGDTRLTAKNPSELTNGPRGTGYGLSVG